MQYLSLFHALPPQVSCPAQQWAHIFPSLRCVSYGFREALLVAFGVPRQIQLQVGLQGSLARLLLLQSSTPLTTFAARAQR